MSKTLITLLYAYPFNLAEADLIPAPVVQLRRFDVRVPGHTLGDVDVPAVLQVDQCPSCMAQPIFTLGQFEMRQWEAGHFPVLIYAPSVNAPATENIELCEYLASQGFVVIASPSMGATSRVMTVDPSGANAEAQDISFLIDSAATLPDTDMSKVAAIGYSWGGMAALFASGRDKRIDVLASLDGSFRYSPETVREAGDIHPERTKGGTSIRPG